MGNRRSPAGGLARLARLGACLVLCAACELERTGDEPTADGPAAGPAPAFTYTLLQTADANDAAARLTADLPPRLGALGARLYSVWVPVPGALPEPPSALPGDAPSGRRFAGLEPTQLALTLAWPGAAANLDALHAALESVAGATVQSTRLYDAIYLVDGLRVPTGRGFYVHREERYRAADVAEAVRLSREAWATFEPAFGARVVALLRERQAETDVARLLRIVWYPSAEAWVASRDFSRDPESLRRFRARAQLQQPGSNTAIATDRAEAP